MHYSVSSTTSTLRKGNLMDDQSLREFLEKMQGQISGINIVLEVLLLTHPNPGLVAAALSEELERWRTSALYKTNGDAAFGALESTVATMISVAQSPD